MNEHRVWYFNPKDWTKDTREPMGDIEKYRDFYTQSLKDIEILEHQLDMKRVELNRAQQDMIYFRNKCSYLEKKILDLAPSEPSNGDDNREP